MSNRNSKTTAIALAAVFAATVCLAQEVEPLKVKETGKMQVQVKDERPDLHFFKLDFVVKEVDGPRVLTSRSFTILVSAAPSSTGFIRSGMRVQLGDSSHIDYNDVGVHIDCRYIREVQSQLAINVSADITVTPQDVSSSYGPIMRHYQWSSDALVQLKKPTVIFSSDSVSSKSQMELELTATPIS